MKVYDTVNKVELEATEKELVDIMVNGRQVDLILNEKKTDADGYLTWDVEHWSSIDNKRFIRCYSLEGRVLSESTGHNIYDLANDFKPEEAKEYDTDPLAIPAFLVLTTLELLSFFLFTEFLFSAVLLIS